METIEVYNPTGHTRTKAVNRYAIRLARLQGKTICELSNAHWEAHVTFPYIEKALQEKVPDVKFVPYSQLPEASYRTDTNEILRAVRDHRCDAVIGGNAG